MRALVAMVRLMVAAAPRAMAGGAALAVAVLVMGAALLGLSGWFITATGLAGLAGAGLIFDVFRPSAGVRALALGRTAARYGERLATHEATLRALAALRVAVLRGHRGLDARAMARLRAEASLTRITADVDALDGLIARLALPLAAGLAAHLAAFAGLAWLAGWAVAAVVAALYLPASALIFWRLARATRAPSAQAEAHAQQLRRGLIALMADREALIAAGQLARGQEALMARDAAARAAEAALDRAERRAGAALALVVTLAVAGAMLAGAWVLAEAGAARAAIGLFVALALAETVLPLRRGVAEIGRMARAAARVQAGIDGAQHTPPGQPPAPAGSPRLPNTAAPPAQAAPGPRVATASAATAADLPAASGAAAPDPSGAKPNTAAPPAQAAPGPHAAPCPAGATASAARPALPPRPAVRIARGGVDITIAPGQAVALCGPSGVGKSTLLHAIAALGDDRGITLAGRAPSVWTEDSLRARLSLLPQRSALIAGTVRDNLTLAGAAPDAALWAALETAQMTPVIRARGGLEARLAGGGAGLSGGQARRLAIARCLLKSPDILALDEPTEGLDRATATALLHAIRAALPDATIIVATHRGADHPIFDATFTLGQRDSVTNR